MKFVNINFLDPTHSSRGKRREKKVTHINFIRAIWRSKRAILGHQLFVDYFVFLLRKSEAT